MLSAMTECSRGPHNPEPGWKQVFFVLLNSRGLAALLKNTVLDRGCCKGLINLGWDPVDLQP